MGKRLAKRVRDKPDRTPRPWPREKWEYPFHAGFASHKAGRRILQRVSIASARADGDVGREQSRRCGFRKNLGMPPNMAGHHRNSAAAASIPHRHRNRRAMNHQQRSPGEKSSRLAWPRKEPRSRDLGVGSGPECWLFLAVARPGQRHRPDRRRAAGPPMIGVSPLDVSGIRRPRPKSVASSAFTIGSN